ncbi:hypothetical protein I3679_019235 [Proteus mirabilis]|uniref:Uncharacterized protein n=1 Tax=Proteus mirabilis TaxID=584 RepID=A0ABD5LUV8_PROMI
MMKIAYLDPYPVPDLRVASLQILQNVDAFARAGAQVTLVTPKDSIEIAIFSGVIFIAMRG